MRKILKFLLMISLLCSIQSCRDKSALCYDYDMIMLLNREFNGEAAYTQDIVNSKLLVLNNFSKDSSEVNRYNNLTKDYVASIDDVIKELTLGIENYDSIILSESKIADDYFFIGEDYTDKANQFITTTEKYRTEILKIIDDNYFLSNKVNRILDTSDIYNKDGRSISRLNYFYKDMSLASVITHLTGMIRNVLQMEDSYLYECLLKTDK